MTVYGNSYIQNTLTASSIWISSGLTVQNGYQYTQNSHPFIITSDRRLKTNIKPISGAISKVSKLKGVYFDWINDKPAGVAVLDDRRHIGLIAQDVREVVPEAVFNLPNQKHLGVDYGSLVSLLISAFNEYTELQSNSNNTSHSNVLLESIKSKLVAFDYIIKSIKNKQSNVIDANASLKASMEDIWKQIEVLKASSI